jgi:hypothetical protein
MPTAAAALLDRLGRPGAIHLGAVGPAVERLPTGLPPLDAVLGGGLPRGRITELAGGRSAGRTGLACRIAASATATGAIIAWVDTDDTLDPEAAAAAGLVLDRTLWVRPRTPEDASRAAELLLAAGGFGLVILDQTKTRTALPWPRLARAAEQTRSTLLFLTLHRQAGSYAALGLELTARQAKWTRGPGDLVLLDGITSEVTVARNRIGRPGHTLTVRQACA